MHSNGEKAALFGFGPTGATYTVYNMFQNLLSAEESSFCLQRSVLFTAIVLLVYGFMN